jgi:predicted transcriptional regulator
MPRQKTGRQDLSPLELDIMNVIWDLGECTSADVVEAYQRKRALATTTIRTVMSNIRRKGFIEMAPSVESRARFRPRVTRREVARRSVKRLLDDFFGGSARDAVSFLIVEEPIDATQLDDIRRLIDERRA